MSVPPAVNRSYFEMPGSLPNPINELIEELFKPHGEIAQFIDRSSEADLYLAIGLLYEMNLKIDERFEQVIEKTKEQIRKYSDDKDYPVYLNQFRTEATRAILSSGKIAVSLAALLHRETESKAELNLKSGRITLVMWCIGGCKQLAQEISQYPIAKRMAWIQCLVGDEHMKLLYREFTEKFGIDEDVDLCVFRSLRHSDLWSDQEKNSLSNTVLAAAIADTIGGEFSVKLGEHLIADNSPIQIDEWVSRELLMQLS